MTAKTTFSYLKRATRYEKYKMQEICGEENKFQQQEPGGWDENDNDCPITYKVEKRSDWQMTAYMPSGKLMDGFHTGFCRCGVCGGIFTWGGEDVIMCGDCYTDFNEEDCNG